MRCGCKRLSRRHMDLIELCRPFAVRRRQHHRIFASDALHKTCNPLSPLPFGCKGKREQIDMFNCNCHAVQCSWNVCFISSRITECGNEENHWRLPRTGTVESLKNVVNASQLQNHTDRIHKWRNQEPSPNVTLSHTDRIIEQLNIII